MPGYLKANCRENFNPLKTLFPYSLTRRKWPSKLGGFETEIGHYGQPAVTLPLESEWLAGQPRAAAMGEARPAEIDWFSSCLAGPVDQAKHPAGRHVTSLHGCLRDLLAGAASSATKLL